MIVRPTPLRNAAVIQVEPIQDSRGYFARSFCKRTLAEHGIAFEAVQTNIAFNHQPRTLRGMHLQLPPYSEDKIVTCTSGAIYDVIIDLNRSSSTFGQWYGLTLSAVNQLSLYVPKGFAHGYQTLSENSGIHYMVSEYYMPSHESGVRWNDQAFGIEWPIKEELIISLKDEQWQDFRTVTDGVTLPEGDDMDHDAVSRMLEILQAGHDGVRYLESGIQRGELNMSDIMLLDSLLELTDLLKTAAMQSYKPHRVEELNANLHFYVEKLKQDAANDHGEQFLYDFRFHLQSLFRLFEYEIAYIVEDHVE